MSFQTVTYTIDRHGLSNAPNEPFSMVLLADLHNCQIGKHNARLLGEIENIRPDLILSAGDLVTAKAGRGGYGEAAMLLGALKENYPVFLINGNHELRMKETGLYGDSFEEYLHMVGCAEEAESSIGPDGLKCGVFMLSDQNVHMRLHGMNLAIAGYDVPLSCYHRARRTFVKIQDLQMRLGFRRKEEYQLLLAHHPDSFPAYAAWGADLVLSGHIHGGMIRLPYLGGVIGGSLVPFPKYTRGEYRHGNARMLLSPGLGAHTIKVRINNPAQLIHICFC